MSNKIADLKKDIAEMQEVFNDASTPANIKKAIEPALKKAKDDLAELEKKPTKPDIKRVRKAAAPKPEPKPESNPEPKVLVKPERKKITPAKPAKKRSTKLSKYKDAAERRKTQGGVPSDFSDIERDARRAAISIKGKRISKNGNVYYEYRDNRWDKRPKKYPKLEEGGQIREDLHIGDTVSFEGKNYMPVIHNTGKVYFKKLDTDQNEFIEPNNPLWQKIYTDSSIVKKHYMGDDEEMGNGGKIEDIENLKIGHCVDWKFGLISRDVCRNSENEYEINDTSSGWQQANVTKKELIELIKGKLSLDNLEWYGDGGQTGQEKLYKVVGKKNGQLVEISELPMIKYDCEIFIKKEGINNHYNDVAIIPYHGTKEPFAYTQQERYFYGNQSPYQTKRAEGGEVQIPQEGDDVRGFGHKYGTRIKEVNEKNRTFKINNGDYWDSGDSWISFDKVSYSESHDAWIRKMEEGGGYMAKGGNIEESLLKELHKLQRDLNSNRLSTYREGDNSEEEIARKRERASKMARFEEVRRLLNEIDSKKMEHGGYMAKGGSTDKKSEKYQVLSPDGFTIEFDKMYYPSKEKAVEAFQKWKKRYEGQGYYSSPTNGRIPIDQLEDYVSITEYKKYAEGGSISDQNTEMLISLNNQIQHHANEIGNILTKDTEVMAWVLAKAERAASDLSDIAHFLDGQKQSNSPENAN